jgi:altronate dehydratase small subunit
VPKSAILIDQKDNVATALRRLGKDEIIKVWLGTHIVPVRIIENIPTGHKIALSDLGPGESIIKYGEVIGLATKIILKGEHVHIHNIEGQKGRGDKA